MKDVGRDDPVERLRQIRRKPLTKIGSDKLCLRKLGPTTLQHLLGEVESPRFGVEGGQPLGKVPGSDAHVEKTTS